MCKKKESTIIAFDKKLITGLYRNDDSNYLIIRFPKSSVMKDYIWSVLIDRVVFNASCSDEDYVRGFNKSRCLIKADPEEQLRAFRLNAAVAADGNCIEDIISLSPEEMKECLKPSFEQEYKNYLDSRLS